MDGLYRQLQRKLNTIGVGLPESDAGFELKYLAELYTDEEAEFALKMDVGLHSAEEVAKSMAITLEYAEKMLRQMSLHGLVYRVNNGDVTEFYLVTGYHGFFEFNPHRMTPSISHHMAQHFGKGLGARFWASSIPLFRYLPLNRDVVENGECLEIDDMEAIIRRQEKIAVMPCLCRLSHHLRGEELGGHECKVTSEPYEVCLLFGEFVDFYLENGVGRSITTEEALDIMRKCNENGLSVEVMNTRNVETMCCCCSCCCGVIAAYKMFKGLSKEFASNYRVKHEESACTNCGKCAQRCPVGAIKVIDGAVTMRLDRCLGCGLCVTTCEGKALKLYRKPAEELYYPADQSVLDLFDDIRVQRRKTFEI